MRYRWLHLWQDLRVSKAQIRILLIVLVFFVGLLMVDGLLQHTKKLELPSSSDLGFLYPMLKQKNAPITPQVAVRDTITIIATKKIEKTPQPDVASQKKQDLRLQKKKNAYLRTEINKATVEDWQSFSGIGVVLSKRIVEYREKLGGFYSVEQIKEVRGISDSLWQVLAGYFWVDTLQYTRINLNTADFKELLKHPYVDYNLANALLNMRKQLGGFAKIEQIKSSKLMSDSLYQKLEPYFQVK